MLVRGSAYERFEKKIQNRLFYNNDTLRNIITLYFKFNCNELSANLLELIEARQLILSRSNGGGETGSLQLNSRSEVNYKTGTGP